MKTLQENQVMDVEDMVYLLSDILANAKGETIAKIGNILLNEIVVWDEIDQNFKLYKR